MNAFDTAVKFFQDSGLFIYPSILIMALGLSIAIERFIFLNRARTENRKLWAQVLPMLQNGKFKEVQHVSAQVRRGDRQDRHQRPAAHAERRRAAKTSTPRWKRA